MLREPLLFSIFLTIFGILVVFSYAVITKQIHLQENTTSTPKKILAKLIDQNATVCK